MEFTKEQVEMFKDDAESAPFKHGYDVMIIGLCDDWLEMSERTCETCKWWQVFDDGVTVGFQCRSDKVMIFEPSANFGCNQWESN